MSLHQTSNHEYHEGKWTILRSPLTLRAFKPFSRQLCDECGRRSTPAASRPLPAASQPKFVKIHVSVPEPSISSILSHFACGRQPRTAVCVTAVAWRPAGVRRVRLGVPHLLPLAPAQGHPFGRVRTPRRNECILRPLDVAHACSSGVG